MGHSFTDTVGMAKLVAPAERGARGWLATGGLVPPRWWSRAARRGESI
jgi:hypothetical protein